MARKGFFSCDTSGQFFFFLVVNVFPLYFPRRLVLGAHECVYVCTVIGCRDLCCDCVEKSCGLRTQSTKRKHTAATQQNDETMWETVVQRVGRKREGEEKEKRVSIEGWGDCVTSSGTGWIRFEQRTQQCSRQQQHFSISNPLESVFSICCLSICTFPNF